MNAALRERQRALGSLPRPRARVLDAAFLCVVLLGTHSIYRASTGHIQNCDSEYSLFVAEKLMAEGSVNLAGSIPRDPAVRRAMQGYGAGQDLPYQMILRPDPIHGPNVYYGYPLGSTILSMPFVAAIEARRGFTMIHADGRPNTTIEDQIQLRIAAMVCAGIVALFYLMCRFYCSPCIALLIAGGFAIGSPVWSTMARSLWSHDWMVLLLSASLLLVMVRRNLSGGWRTDLGFGVLLGTLQFGMLFTRAHGIYSTLAIGLYLVVHHRRMLLATIGAGSMWMAAGVALSLHTFGTLTPPTSYSLDTIDGHNVLDRFRWLMVSPSRGLAVYCPYVIAAVAILVIFRRHLVNGGLLLPAGIAIAGNTILLACYNGWHMGSSYGPRYFCDVLPWFVVIVATAVRAVQDAPVACARKSLAFGGLALCLGWGIFVDARGANSMQAWLWNARSSAVGQEESVKDWQHPQFLGGLTFDVQLDGTIVER